MAEKVQDAKLVQVLLWYDKPEVILLEGPKLVYTVAVRSGDLKSNDRTYVGGSMTARRLRDFANSKCDLRYAIAHANLRQFWKFELADGQKEVAMTQIKRSNGELISSIPDPGIFSDDLEAITVVANCVPDTVEKFFVDGGWDLGEFSQFYGQVEDVYYIVSDIDRFDDPKLTIQERDVIKDAFDRSWDGGGSYVAFYKNVANDNDFHSPLRVSGISYNSPGHVKIFANKEPFDNLLNLLQTFSLHESEARRAYNLLGNFMSANRLKKKGALNALLSDKIKNSLEEKCQSLAEYLPRISFDTLRAMTGGDTLVAAKVLSSVFRRIERLHKFFDEGRVTHPSIEVV